MSFFSYKITARIKCLFLGGIYFLNVQFGNNNTLTDICNKLLPKRDDRNFIHDTFSLIFIV